MPIAYVNGNTVQYIKKIENEEKFNQTEYTLILYIS